MKKLLTISTFIVLCLAIGTIGIAQADDIIYRVDPPPYIVTWTTHPSDGIPQATTGTVDVLGPEFQSYGAKIDYTNNKLYLYSLFGPGQTDNLSTTPAKAIVAADLFLSDANGNDYMVRLTSTTGEQGNVYSVASANDYSTSVQEMTGLGGTNYQFGGQYSLTNPATNAKYIPVWATVSAFDTTGVSTSQGAVNEGPFNLDDNTWTYCIDLDGILDASDGFSFLWGTGQCANDTIGGVGVAPLSAVPLPGAMLLLGVGLARLAAYRRRARVV